MIFPLTTRSNHSQALLTIRKQTTVNDHVNQSISVLDGRESEVPAYNMDAQNSSRAEHIGIASSNGTQTPNETKYI